LSSDNFCLANNNDSKDNFESLSFMQLPLLVGIAHLTAKGTVNHSMLASNLKSFFVLYEIPIAHFAVMRSNIVVTLCNKSRNYCITAVTISLLYCYMYYNGYARISQVLLSESSNNEDYQMPEDGNC